MAHDQSFLLLDHIKQVQAILHIVHHNERSFIEVKVGVGSHVVNYIVRDRFLFFLLTLCLPS